MPLTKRQFELRIDQEIESWMREIYALLSDNRELAYSSEEIQESTVGAVFGDAEVRFYRALNVLVEIGAAEKRSVANDAYYAFRSKFDTSSWS